MRAKALQRSIVLLKAFEGNTQVLLPWRQDGGLEEEKVGAVVY